MIFSPLTGSFDEKLQILRIGGRVANGPSYFPQEILEGRAARVCCTWPLHTARGKFALFVAAAAAAMLTQSVQLDPLRGIIVRENTAVT